MWLEWQCHAHSVLWFQDPPYVEVGCFKHDSITYNIMSVTIFPLEPPPTHLVASQSSASLMQGGQELAAAWASRSNHSWEMRYFCVACGEQHRGMLVGWTSGSKGTKLKNIWKKNLDCQDCQHLLKQ
jgi:hypothetical protein